MVFKYKMAIVLVALVIGLIIIVTLINIGFFNKTASCPYIYNNLIPSGILSLNSASQAIEAISNTPFTFPVYTTSQTIIIPKTSLISYLQLTIVVDPQFLILVNDIFMIYIYYEPTNNSNNVSSAQLIYNSDDYQLNSQTIVFNGYAKKKMGDIIANTAPTTYDYTMRFLVKKYQPGNELIPSILNVSIKKAMCLSFVWDTNTVYI